MDIQYTLTESIPLRALEKEDEDNERVTTGAETREVLMGISVHNFHYSDLHEQIDGKYMLRVFCCSQVSNLQYTRKFLTILKIM
jgi:hypothetical protein